MKIRNFKNSSWYYSEESTKHRKSFNHMKDVYLTLGNTHYRRGTLGFRYPDVLNILLFGVPETRSRKNEKGKFSTFTHLIFSKPRRHGTNPKLIIT